MSKFKYDIYSPLGNYIRTATTSKELDSKGKIKLREREAKKYGGPVLLSKPLASQIENYAESIKYN